MEAYQSALDWLATQDKAMQSRLKQWASINSGSYHLAGLAKMATALTNEFQRLDTEIRALPLDPAFEIDSNGNVHELHTVPALFLQKRPQAPLQVILTGHFDTVYPKNHPFQSVKAVDNNTLIGPGVADMKGGLLVLLYSLLALEQHPLAEKIGWSIFLNPDEEIGSICSAPFLEKYAQSHHLGLVFEPAMTPSGTLACKRKGSGKFTLVVRGVSAHAGRNFKRGRSAIVAMAQAVESIHALNGRREGVTINIGQIKGGSAINTVPDTCTCRIDVRITKDEDQNWVNTQFSEICDKISALSEIDVTLQGDFGRQPKILDEKTQRLLDLFADTGKLLNLTIDWQPSGGCCDGNNLASAGLPVIDSLGVRGGKIHSPEEYILLDSLVERAQLTCLFLLRLASGEIKLKEP